MSTLKDFLVHFNLNDIDPMNEAILNLQKFYRKEKIDIFKDTISIPGATRNMLFQSPQAKFTLFHQKKMKIYSLRLSKTFSGDPLWSIKDTLRDMNH